MIVAKISKFVLATALLVLLAFPAQAADVYGRVVEYDKAEKKVTFIEDKLAWSNPQRPEFTVLPAKEAILPEDPADMAPKAGGRLRVDYEKKEIIIYNSSTKAIDTFGIEIVSKTDNVEADNPLVSDGGKPKVFPVVDKAKSEITIYSRRQKNVCTIKVPESYMSLPDAVWDDGHNIKLAMDGDKVTGFTNLSKAK
jgi:hypothetical protein